MIQQTRNYNIQYLNNVLVQQVQLSCFMFQIDTLTNIYLVATIGVLTFTLYDTYTKSDNYFSMWLNYLDNPMTNFIFYNFIISVSIIFYKLNILAFFSQVKQNETMKILQKLRNKIFDFIIFLYITGGHFSFQVFACVVFIFLLFVCHYQAIFRSQYLIHTPTTLSLNLNYRLLANLFILGFLDYQLISHNIDLLFADQPAKVMFIYYIFNITLSIIQPITLFFVDFYEKYTLTHIHKSDEIMAQVSIYINVPKLIIQIVLSLWISIKFGLLFWMILTIIQFVLQINTIIKSHGRIKKLTDTMKNLKRVSQEQLKQHHDHTCMVCFQDIKQGVLLPCRHIFHDECLRQWILKNANHFCPKCKKQFNFEKKKDEVAEPIILHHIPFGRRLNNNNLGGLNNLNNLNNPNLNQNGRRYNFNGLNNNQNDPKQNNFNNNWQQNINQQNFNKANNLERGNFKKPSQRRQEQKMMRQEVPNKNENNSLEKSIESYQQNQNIMLNEVNLMSLDTPLQVLQLKRRLLVRIGSLPFGMPTHAVNYRTVRHMTIRQKYERANQQLVRNLSCSPEQQMLLLAGN